MGTEYPKFLYLDKPENSILTHDADEEKTARAAGFRDVWGEKKGDDEVEDDEMKDLLAKLKAAGVKPPPRAGIDHLRKLAAEAGI